MATWLLKTEPGEYAYADLEREKKTVWTGVANPGALIHLRAMRKGDHAFIYHTGDERAIVGIAQVTSGPREDPDKPGLNPRGEPKFAVIDVRAVNAAKTPLTLASMKADKQFAGFDLLRLPRLSVMPVPAGVEAAIRGLAGL